MISGGVDYTSEFEADSCSGDFEIGLIARSNFNMPEDMTPTATGSSEKSDLFSADFAIDGETREPFKYWILGRGCKLGDGWRLLGTGSKHNLGWWSSNKSDASGDFSAPYPYHETVYSAAVDCNLVRVITTTVYSGIEEFILYLWYEGAGAYTEIGTYTISGGDTQATVALAEVKHVTKVKVAVTKTADPEENAKLVEVELALEYSPATSAADTYVLDFTIEKGSGESVPGRPAAPGVGANSLDITFDRDVSILAIPSENQIITFKQGFGDHLISQGSFIVLEPPEETLQGYRCKAYSSLQAAKYYDVPDLIFHNRTTSQICGYILGALGIPDDKVVYSLASDPTWEWYILERSTIGGILAQVADHFGVAIYQTEDGTVHVRSSYGASAYTFTDAVISDISCRPAAAVNVVVVHYCIVSQEAEDSVWELDNDITIPASSSVTYVFPLTKSPATAIKSPRLTEEAAAVASDVAISSWRCNGFYLNLTLANSAGTSKTVPKSGIEIRALPLALTAERVYEAKNQTSIRKLGRREFETTLFCASDAVAQGVANQMLVYLNKASKSYKVDLDRPMPHLQVRDVATLDSDTFDVIEDVVLTNIRLSRGATSFEAISKEAVA